MSSSVSPYALLRASKPKPAPTVVTPYDLYSAAQTATAPLQGEAPAAQPPQAEPPATAPAQMYAPRRTHYIADIKSRHNQAVRRTSLGR